MNGYLYYGDQTKDANGKSINQVAPDSKIDLTVYCAI